MIATDEDALACDFAQVYHIHDFRALPARRAALFACGLGPESRIIRKMTGARASETTLLLAVIADAVRILAWQNTADGHRGQNPPVSLLEILTGEKETEITEVFDTPDDFNQWREAMMKGGGADG